MFGATLRCLKCYQYAPDRCTCPSPTGEKAANKAPVTCGACGGRGQVTTGSGTSGWPPRMYVETCERCGGVGKLLPAP